VPEVTIQPQDNIAQLKDQGLRGSAVIDYGSVQGQRFATVTLAGPVFTDTFPYLVGGVTGATDFSAGTPNIHAFSVKNTGDTQPTPLLMWINDGIDTRIYAGCRVEELQLMYDTGGLFAYTAKIESYMSGPVSALTPSFGTVQPGAGWMCQASIGAAVAYVESAQITIKRGVQEIFTLQGINDPYKLFAGPQEVDGTLTIVMEDNTQLNNFLNHSQPVLDLLFTPPGANPQTVQVHVTKCNFETAPPTITGNPYVRLPITFKGEANLTDATAAGTGFAVTKITCKSLKPTGTYL